MTEFLINHASPLWRRSRVVDDVIKRQSTFHNSIESRTGIPEQEGEDPQHGPDACLVPLTALLYESLRDGTHLRPACYSYF